MKKYFFIGIGGIGMSGLAKILIEKGNTVWGSDPAINKQTDELEKLGAKIFHKHDADNITEDIDALVITSAINEDNSELKRAKELGLKIISRSQMLNEIITSNHKAIAITGTHGKTTTSSILTSILETAGLDPTASIGAEVHTISGNAKSGKGEYSVAEVCEYQKAFLDIYPYSAIITNIEEDHLDCYKDINDIIEAFKEFITHLDKTGFLVAFGDDKNIDLAISDFKGELIRYGLTDKNDVFAQNIKTENKLTYFDINFFGKIISNFVLEIPGKHNILNALAATIVALKLGVEPDVIKKVLRDFRGAQRRFQILGKLNGVTYVDDYAHHPTEIRATLKGAKEYFPSKRLIAVFQPHQHSRTRLLLDDFSKSFENADIVMIPEIYAVRDSEQDIKSVSSLDLVNKINEITPQKAIFCKDFEDTNKILAKTIKNGDVVLTIGAGPVNKIALEILK